MIRTQGFLLSHYSKVSFINFTPFYACKKAHIEELTMLIDILSLEFTLSGQRSETTFLS